MGVSKVFYLPHMGNKLLRGLGCALIRLCCCDSGAGGDH